MSVLGKLGAQVKLWFWTERIFMAAHCWLNWLLNQQLSEQWNEQFQNYFKKLSIWFKTEENSTSFISQQKKTKIWLSSCFVKQQVLQPVNVFVTSVFISCGWGSLLQTYISSCFQFRTPHNFSPCQNHMKFYWSATASFLWERDVRI